jgi:tetratricopeptide (TPR) repeat protein
LSESFLNLGTVIWYSGHREEALELVKHSIDYGRAGLVRRPHDLEFATDLGGSFDTTASFCWQLDHRDEALAISADGIAYRRKLSDDNPDVRGYRDALAQALGAHGLYLRDLGRTEEAVSSTRQAAEALETKQDPDPGALATAAILRGRIAGLLAENYATTEFNLWPAPARREADTAVADLRAAVARGFRRADLVRADSVLKTLVFRDDVKALLAEIDQPPVRLSAALAPAVTLDRAPSPLDQPGRLAEDRFLSELSIELLESQSGEPQEVRARLTSMLARIDAQRKSSPHSAALEESSQSIRLRIGELIWKTGKLAEARSVWDEAIAPLRGLGAADQRREAVLAHFAPVFQRITNLYMELHGIRPLGTGRRV